MAIKKRTSKPDADDMPAKVKLNIVAKPKTPIPQDGVLQSIYNGEATPQQARRLGLLAIDCKADRPDENFTPDDHVKLMRIPYDKTNPQEARYRNRVRNRGTAITAMCITCQGGRKAVTECVATDCPLWAFRFGSDPFYGKRKK
jgi:hypothetical protein